MNLKVGDIVSRNSYGNDVVFEIINIVDDVAILKGTFIRLIADAPLSDLTLSENRDEYEPECNFELMNRDEYFYMPGKILHIDGDEDYLKKSLDFYKKAGVAAIGKCVKESDIPLSLEKLLHEYRPDILVLTGHDALYDKNEVLSYKNSKYFIKGVHIARDYEKSHEKLVIIAGACQSDYENLIKSGANFASSPKRVNIHALDPAVIAVNVALTDKKMELDLKDLLNKTKYGKNGIGGLMGNGMMYIGYPR